MTVSKNVKPTILKMAKTKLFQIPFNTNQIKNYKGISKLYVGDCVFQALTVLRLRDKKISSDDSKRMYQMYKGTNDGGVYDEDISKYLSFIFNTKIKDNITSCFDTSLKDGYATILAVGYKKNKRQRVLNGHCFIAYKENGIIYFYDPPTRKITNKINDIMNICNTKAFNHYTFFHNIKLKDASLKINKIVAPIAY
jgi:hypothetical protein